MSRPTGGFLITLEGGDGSGKSTLAKELAERLRKRGYRVRLTQEPSGTALGRLIKGIFQRRESAGQDAPVSPLAEMFLFQAARSQHVQTVINPALEAGEIVLCDRFTDSTLAYQGYGRCLPLEHVRVCNEMATGGLAPDITLLLDAPPEVGLHRADSGAPKKTDSIGQETLDFHRRVRDGYLELARQSPGRVLVIDATLAQPTVTDLAWRAIEPRIGPKRS